MTELTVVQAGPAYCMEHLAGAKVAVDTLNALNANKGFAVGVAGDTFVRLRLVTILTAAESDADYDAFHDDVVRAMLTSGGFAAAYGAPRYLIGTCNKGPFADAEKLASDDAGVMLMAQIGPDETYESGGLPNLFGMHLSSYTYSVPVLQQLRRSGAKKIAVVTSSTATSSSRRAPSARSTPRANARRLHDGPRSGPGARLQLFLHPTADDDGDGVANRVDVKFLNNTATEVCESGADVFMACVQTDEAELLVAKWQALDCVPDAVWLTCAGWGASTRIGSDARNYAAAGGQWFAAMPYSDEFFATTTALVDAGEAQFGYRFGLRLRELIHVRVRPLSGAAGPVLQRGRRRCRRGGRSLRRQRLRAATRQSGAPRGPRDGHRPRRLRRKAAERGAETTAVQVLPGTDGTFSPLVVSGTFAETQYVYPAPAALPCPLDTFERVRRCVLPLRERVHAVPHRVDDPRPCAQDVDGAGAVSVASCMCPAGSGIQGSASDCSRCLPGTYAAIPGVTSCTSAAPGFYVPLEGALGQLECPAGRVSGPAASICRTCPTGSWSPAGSARCDVRKHYYRWLEDSDELYSCPAHDDACRGNAGVGDALCAENATGPLCMLCEPDHHRVVSSRRAGPRAVQELR